MLTCILDDLDLTEDMAKSHGIVIPNTPTYPWPSIEVRSIDYAKGRLLFMIATVFPYRLTFQLVSLSVFTSPKTSCTYLGTTIRCKGCSNLTPTTGIPWIYIFYAWRSNAMCYKPFRHHFLYKWHWSYNCQGANISKPIIFSDRLLQDFSNPFFWFAMQEYPEDTSCSMSQVFHGAKMLYELPSDIRPLAVKVNNKIYFLDEVLQCLNGQYFVLEWFLYLMWQHANDGGSCELFTQGHAVHLVDVSSSTQLLKYHIFMPCVHMAVRLKFRL